MGKLNRILTNICSDDLPASKDFYCTLFDLEVAFDSDWFLQLISKDKHLELGIIDRKNDLVPKAYQEMPNGFYLTFVVDDADAVYEIAKSAQFEVLAEPLDTSYGQRRVLLKDPNGALVDVSSPIPNFKFA